MEPEIQRKLIINQPNNALSRSKVKDEIRRPSVAKKRKHLNALEGHNMSRQPSDKEFEYYSALRRQHQT